jgi:hypothetical protein
MSEAHRFRDLAQQCQCLQRLHRLAGAEPDQEVVEAHGGGVVLIDQGRPLVVLLIVPRLEDAGMLDALEQSKLQLGGVAQGCGLLLVSAPPRKRCRAADNKADRQGSLRGVDEYEKGQRRSQWVTGGGPGRATGGRDSGVGLVAHAIAATLNDHRLGVMQQAVEQG